MAASRRVDQWDVFAGARGLLTGQGKCTRVRMLNTHCQGNAPTPFTPAVVDEVQDISLPELLFLGPSPETGRMAGSSPETSASGSFARHSPGRLPGECKGGSRSQRVNSCTSQEPRSQSDCLLPSRARRRQTATRIAVPALCRCSTAQSCVLQSNPTVRAASGFWSTWLDAPEAAPI